MKEHNMIFGPHAEAVIRNTAEVMRQQNLNSNSLARKISEIDAHGINQLGIRRLVAGDRKPSVDDLFNLAAAMNVDPMKLADPTAKFTTITN